eukprot:CAMPEP_0118874290 /NCGR_PEP_ID=MMETSP1163-20130328/15797_1 /TAXON_ID=124430 /ORGANISM="Phaeomonas parva, Strain CCMP2877" /LENGTH=69 /DNA_ID=CAMNT_0006809669 /DNA_START=109 /DNA_END=314 /DNA_ORIENTATION=+
MTTTFPTGSRLLFVLFPNAYNNGFAGSPFSITYTFPQTVFSVSELNSAGLLHCVTVLDSTVLPNVYIYS